MQEELEHAERMVFLSGKKSGRAEERERILKIIKKHDNMYDVLIDSLIKEIKKTKENGTRK